MKSSPINVYSEIGRLKCILLHRPGKELENLVPDYLDRLLFDDIPYLESAQKEHDAFAKVLSDNGIEVLYLEQLTTESLNDPKIKEAFLNEYLDESGLVSPQLKQKIKDHLYSLSTFDMVLKTMEGFRKTEINLENSFSLSHATQSDYPFLIDPMPNLYFTRDPFSTIGHGISLNYMFAETRNRETIYGKYIFNYHPTYGGQNVPFYYKPEEATSLEGGDILILSKDVVAIGISQRTQSQSIETIAKNLFEHSHFKTVLAFLIENNRKYMHLDTVFTMVDYDKFTYHPDIEKDLQVFSLTKGLKNDIIIEELTPHLETILSTALNLSQVTLIPCGGGDPVIAAREQWNDGSNTLTIAPGEVIVYERNKVTNALLEEAGIKLHRISGSELVRGRGGPRCMSMPLYREDI